MLIKRQYSPVNIVLIGNIDKKTIWCNLYCLYLKFWLKDNMLQCVFLFEKVLLKLKCCWIYVGMLDWKSFIKRKYGETHIVVLENVDYKVLRFNPDCLLRKCWSKDNANQPIFSLFEILMKRKYGATRIVFIGNFDQNSIYWGVFCLLKNI